MSSINRVPFGLQSLLGNTNFGDNPGVLQGEARAVIPIGDFLRVDLLRKASGPTAAFDANSSVGPPLGELWEIVAIASFAQEASGVAATAAQVQVGLLGIGPTVASAFYLANSGPVSFGINQSRLLTYELRNPIFIQHGQFVTSLATSTVGTADDIDHTVSCLYRRFTV